MNKTRMAAIAMFLAGMVYVGASVYLGRWIQIPSISAYSLNDGTVLTPERIEKVLPGKPLVIPQVDEHVYTQASKEEISIGKDGKLEESPAAEPKASRQDGITKVSLPGGFGIEMPESGSWLTIAKMIALLLISYLGVRTINLVFNRMERSLRRRANRA